MDEYSVYIVLCADNTLYTGMSNNIEKRVTTHNTGKGAKYVSSRLPVKLVYFESGFTRSEAMKRELAIKRLPKKRKFELINSAELKNSEVILK